MKYRDYKEFSSGEYYHIYNRGVGKMDIFGDASDYELLVHRLAEALFPERLSTEGHLLQSVRYVRKKLPANAFTLVSYVLMPNHYHLLIRQNSDLPLSVMMLNVFGGYSKCFNKKYQRVGSLFQDQFKAIHVPTNEYLVWLSAYIHANPVVAGLVRDHEDYRYSSLSEFMRSEESGLCDTTDVAGQFGTPKEYLRFVCEASELIRERKDLQKLTLEW